MNAPDVGELVGRADDLIEHVFQTKIGDQHVGFIVFGRAQLSISIRIVKRCHSSGKNAARVQARGLTFCHNSALGFPALRQSSMTMTPLASPATLMVFVAES